MKQHKVKKEQAELSSKSHTESEHVNLSSFGSISWLFLLSLAAREPLPTWDKQIQSLCFQVNNLLEKIRQAAPEWAAQAMEAQMTQ